MQNGKNRAQRMALAIAFACMAVSAKAATSIVDFPDLPSGTAWITGLTTLFIAAAGLGLGILGLRYVISMISAGLAKRRGR